MESPRSATEAQSPSIRRKPAKAAPEPMSRPARSLPRSHRSERLPPRGWARTPVAMTSVMTVPMALSSKPRTATRKVGRNPAAVTKKAVRRKERATILAKNHRFTGPPGKGGALPAV